MKLLLMVLLVKNVQLGSTPLEHAIVNNVQSDYIPINQVLVNVSHVVQVPKWMQTLLDVNFVNPDSFRMILDTANHVLKVNFHNYQEQLNVINVDVVINQLLLQVLVNFVLQVNIQMEVPVKAVHCILTLLNQEHVNVISVDQELNQTPPRMDVNHVNQVNSHQISELVNNVHQVLFPPMKDPLSVSHVDVVINQLQTKLAVNSVHQEHTPPKVEYVNHVH
jgi:hypothetical protein